MILRLGVILTIVTFVVLNIVACTNPTQQTAAPWQADLGNGYYQNPILYADYSDPDVVAVDGDYYMTASSFNAAPGLPILHSKDLVNWQLINHALPVQVPEPHFSQPRHGEGVWAPNIRYHDEQFWIFYPDPDFGIYVVTAKDPKQEWSKPRLILVGQGLIDPTPLWDDDGKAYLLHGWAKSRAGINNILTLHEMTTDASVVAPQGEIIIDGHQIPGYKTLEGPKFYKRNGYYYIFAPAGGVPVGWQTVFRATNIQGPYEHKTVMEQGDTLTNGPHQGAWVTTPAKEDWFLHFQSKTAYGRIVHLQPMSWQNDWPVIGVDADHDGIGNPVRFYAKPKGPVQNISNLPFSDDFSASTLALQWQWNANYQDDWYSLSANKGQLRLFAQPDIAPETHNLWLNPAILLQKLPAPEFIVQTTMNIGPDSDNISAGLIMFGEDYRWIGMQKTEGKAMLGFAECKNTRQDCTEHFKAQVEWPSDTVTLRFTVSAGGVVTSGYVDSQGRFQTFDELFQARAGRWVGAKVGLFARLNQGQTRAVQHYADFTEFNFSLPHPCCTQKSKF
ncbi:glycoside hydrolase family 43 protein [Paraglaciecola hydrolytica]|uniref:glycoside hydrolase family 43 protein n=1 Tax=Paraglaciecola hydrolytica TaxID=1799789 RepID=UPI000839B042|nr:glycoside hydrolase 43 family protein [Paraglaciecola hydrolytica]